MGKLANKIERVVNGYADNDKSWLKYPCVVSVGWQWKRQILLGELLSRPSTLFDHQRAHAKDGVYVTN